MDGIILTMFWEPLRELSTWERQCIERAEQLFGGIRWLDKTRYDIPTKQHKELQGPSEWMRWTELQTPYTLWSDCDVWWYSVPEFTDMAMVHRMRGGPIPDDAVVWSGAHSEIAEYVMSQIQTIEQFTWTHRHIVNWCRAHRNIQGNAWNLFDSRSEYYQHKEDSRPRMA